jgi:hypothetical protein
LTFWALTDSSLIEDPDGVFRRAVKAFLRSAYLSLCFRQGDIVEINKDWVILRAFKSGNWKQMLAAAQFYLIAKSNTSTRHGLSHLGKEQIVGKRSERVVRRNKRAVRQEGGKMSFSVFFVPDMLRAPYRHRFENVHLTPIVRTPKNG